jgi:alpha-beta hydrolase superfamily lysophospholipase
MPKRDEVLGGIVVLHGSEGGGAGGHERLAKFLAQHGYAALAFTWCASPRYPVAGVPPDVIDIDLEDTVQAIKWLQSRPKMKGKKTALYGWSRGAEQALILASMQQDAALPKLDALAVLGSTDRVFPGWSLNWSPHIPPVKPARAWRWQGKHLELGAPIQIENFKSPVFLSHGLQDIEHGESWYVARSQLLETRLRDQRSADSIVETLYLPEEGHVLSENGMRLHQEKLLDFFGRFLQQGEEA